MTGQTVSGEHQEGAAPQGEVSRTEGDRMGQCPLQEGAVLVAVPRASHSSMIIRQASRDKAGPKASQENKPAKQSQDHHSTWWGTDTPTM